MTQAAASDPLVPADVDLRDFAFMPLEVARLRRSKTWLRAKKRPEIGFYVMNLWAAAWHERPAASLENDDEMLCELAMCAEKRWPQVKDDVMQGWVLCSDGRWYHSVVAEKARESWAAKVAQRARTKAATEAREARRREQQEQRDVQRDVARNDQRNVQRDESRDVHQGTGTVKGQGQGEVNQRTGSAEVLTTVAPPKPPRAAPPAEVRELPEASRATLIAVLLRKQGVPIQGMHPLAQQWERENVTDQQLTEAIAIARMRKPEGNIPPAYLEPIVAEVRQPHRDSSGKTLSQLLAERDAAEAKEATRAAS